MLDPGGGGAPTRRRRKPTTPVSINAVLGGAGVAATSAAAEAVRTPGGPSPATAASQATAQYERAQSEIGLSPAEKRKAKAARRQQRQVVNEYVTQRETERLRRDALEDADSKNPKLKMSPHEIAREIKNSEGEIRRDSRALANSQRILRANANGKVVGFRGVARMDYQNRKSAAKRNARAKAVETREQLDAVQGSLESATTAVNKALTISQLKPGGGPLDAVGGAIDTVTGGVADYVGNRWAEETDADPTTGVQGTDALGAITKPAEALKDFVVRKSEQSGEILNAAGRGDDPGGEAVLDLVENTAQRGRDLGVGAFERLKEGRPFVPGVPTFNPGGEDPLNVGVSDFDKNMAEVFALTAPGIGIGGRATRTITKLIEESGAPAAALREMGIGAAPIQGSRIANRTGLSRGLAAATEGNVPLNVAARLVARKPLRTTLINAPVLSIGAIAANEHPRETARALSDAVGKLPEAEVGPALETAAEVGTLTPQVLFHTAYNLAFNKDVRNTSWKALPGLALETAQFPLILAREMAAEGPTTAISDITDQFIDSATLRWGPAAGKIPYSPEVRKVTAVSGEVGPGGEPPEVTYISQEEWDAMENWEQFDALQKSPELGGALITLTEAAGIGAVMSRGGALGLRAGGKVVGKDLLGARPELRFTLGEAGVRPQRTSSGLVGRAGQDILDVTRKHVQKHRERRAGKLKPSGEGQRQPKIPSVGEGEVAPLLPDFLGTRRRQGAKKAAQFREREELTGGMMERALLGRGQRRTLKQLIKGEKKGKNRGLRHFASNTTKREGYLAFYMNETGHRTAPAIVQHLRERHAQVTREWEADIERATADLEKAEAGLARQPGSTRAIAYRDGRREVLDEVSIKPQELDVMTSVINDINKGKLRPEKEAVQGFADAIGRAGRGEAVISPFIEATHKGEGGLTAAEIDPMAKVIEHEVKEGRAPTLEEQLGPTPAARARGVVREAQSYRKAARALATKAAKLADKISHPERRAAQGKVAKEYREAAKRAGAFERVVRQVQGRMQRKAVAKARRESDAEKREVDLRVERQNKKIEATHGAIKTQSEIIATEVAKAKAKGQKKPTTKAYKNAVKRRNDLQNLRLPSQRRALKASKKLKTKAYANAAKRERDALHDIEAAVRAEPRVKAADRALRHQKKRAQIAEREQRVVEDRARARSERYRKAGATGVTAAEKKLRREGQRYTAVSKVERKRRGDHEPLLERSFGADRTEYVRSLGKERLEEILGTEAKPGYTPDVRAEGKVRTPEQRKGLAGNVPKASTGYLARKGRRDVSKDAILDAFNAQHVAGTKARKFHQITELLGMPLGELVAGLGIKIPDRKITKEEAIGILNRIEEEVGKYSDDYVLINAGRMTDEMRSAMVDAEQRGKLTPNEVTAEINKQIQLRTKETSAPLQALKDSFAEIEQHPDAWAELNGWAMVEKHVADQIQPAPPTGATGAALSAVQHTKALASQLLLGTNPQWLGFQVYANAMLMGIANPRAFFGSGFTAWYDKASLTPAAKRAWEQTIGISDHMVDYGQMIGGRTLASWVVMRKGWQHNRVWQKVQGRSVLDPMFRLDARQNKAFKDIFLHDKVKREAWKRMDARTARIMSGYDRALGAHMPKGKARMEEYQAAFEEVVRDRKTMDALGKEVDAWMGDYLTFTSAERSALANNIMFYGFMRHSLTLSLLTLPRSPIRAAILMKMGQAAVEDKREILRKMARGALRGYIAGQPGFNNDLPEGALQDEISHYMQAYVDPRLDYLPIATLGDFYFQGGFDTPFGTYGDDGWNRIGVGRAAALGNILLEGGVLEPGKLWRAAAVLNPFIATAAEGILGFDLFTGKPMKRGESGIGFLSLSAGEWGEHMLSSFADLAPPVRGAIKGLSQYPSSKKEVGFVPFGEDPIEYEQAYARKAQEQATRRWARNTGTPMDELVRTTAPWAPQQVDPISTLFGIVGSDALEYGIGPDVRAWAKEWKAGGLGKPHSFSPEYEALDAKLPQDRSLLPISDPRYRPPTATSKVPGVEGGATGVAGGATGGGGSLDTSGSKGERKGKVPKNVARTIDRAEAAVDRAIALSHQRKERPKIEGKNERKVATRLQKAVDKRDSGGVPAIVPEEYRKSVKHWGSQPEFVAIAKQHGLTGPELMAKVVTGESNWQGPGAESYAGAQGWTQFMPTTAQDFVERYGFDPTSGSFDDAVHGTFLHMTDYQSEPGIAGYNPNMPTYTDYILGQDVGPLQKGEPVPKGLKQQAVRVLGKKATNSLLSGGAETEQAAPSVVSPVKFKRSDIIATPQDHASRALGDWQSDNAIDIAVPTGTKVRAARAGVVDKVYSSTMDPAALTAGIQVTIGGDTFYTHLSAANVKAGDHVEAGQVIGRSGAANNVEHLHFAVSPGEDPQQVIAGAPARGGAGSAPAPTKPPPAKKVKKWIKLTEAPSEVASEQGVPESKAYKSSVRGMSPELQSALVTLGEQTGIPVEINEGYRTEQRATDFPSGLGSQHHLGNAADVNNHASYTSEQLAAAGLNNTSVSGEPWHFQPNEMPTTSASTGTSAVSTGSFGGSSGSYAPSTSSVAQSAPTGSSVRRSKRRPGRRPNTMALLNAIKTRSEGGLNELLGIPGGGPMTGAEQGQTPLDTALGSAEELRRRTLKRTTA